MFCPNCGFQLPEGSNFCLKCGKKIPLIKGGIEEVTAYSNAHITRTEMKEKSIQVTYAGFFRRATAAFIDSFLWILFVLFVIVLPIDYELYFFIGFFLAWMYYALLESSSWQGTIGKMIMNIKVCDKEGNRISFFRATCRYFFHLLNQLTLLIGYLLVFVTDKRQGLHDLASGCVHEVRVKQ